MNGFVVANLVKILLTVEILLSASCGCRSLIYTKLDLLIRYQIVLEISIGSQGLIYNYKSLF